MEYQKVENDNKYNQGNPKVRVVERRGAFFGLLIQIIKFQSMFRHSLKLQKIWRKKVRLFELDIDMGKFTKNSVETQRNLEKLRS